MRKVEISIFNFDELEEDIQESVIDSAIQFIIDTMDLEKLKNKKDSGLYKAWKKSEDMRTPWFLGSYIWEYAEKEVLELCRGNEYLKDGTVFNSNDLM